LRQRPIEITVFLYSDIAAPDFSGIVYHANYLRFMERGRTNHLRLMGASQQALFEQAQEETPGFAFVVRSMQLDFMRPARMDDVLDVVTWPVAVKGASIRCGAATRCWSRPRCALPSSVRAGRSRSRNRCGC
jgi:acyl-CoA thioester hydrolase